MTTNAECADIRSLLPELALDTLTGEDRARALEHVEACSDCRRELKSLVEVGDELLLVAPVTEPPVGFESRVVERLLGKPRGRNRLKRALAIAAVLVAGIAAGGTAVYLAGNADRELAAGYRRTLGVADGRYVAARPFVGDGDEVGYVFGYEGSPSWIFFVIEDAGDDGTYDIEIATVDGGTRMAGNMQIVDGEGTWHGLLETDLHDLRRISLVDRSGGHTFVAEW